MRKPVSIPLLNLIGLLAAISLSSCQIKKISVGSAALQSGPSTTPTFKGTGVSRDIVVNWSPNRESTVNMSGGGYKVYYGTTSGFSLSTAQMVQVPYVSGDATPTTAKLLKVPSGIYSIVVLAYSQYNPTGTPSAPLVLTVP